jgi:hypothetical protein
VAGVRRRDQPCPHHGVDLIAVSLGVLAVHPLPVQADAQRVHIEGSLYALRLG